MWHWLPLVFRGVVVLFCLLVLTVLGAYLASLAVTRPTRRKP
jgi:hypothetical protein